MNAYPHQLSGGQQQRIVIAMAMLSKPALLLLDEPTTALDVTVEAGIVDLVKVLGKRFGTSMIFVSHNLAHPRDLRPDHGVMYSGEAGGDRQHRGRVQPHAAPIYAGPVPLHCASRHGQERQSADLHSGQLPLPHERPPGCNFGPRCAHFQKGRCDAQDIPMFAVCGRPRHDSRCCG